MEMVSKGWGHAIGGEVSKAQGYLELLRRQLVAMAENIKVTENLEALHKVLDTIADIPIVAPLSSGIYHRKPSH